MLKISTVAVATLLLAGVASAQQVDAGHLMTALENQRNIISTQHAIAEARASMLAEENAKLKARIAELEKLVSKPDDKKE